jgi:SAM-dependent methyltransferase
MAIFKENLTSKILQKNCLITLNKNFKNKIDILEIGCGNGNISKFLIKNQKKKNFYYLSDISNQAIELARKNIKYKNIEYKVGSTFCPWEKKFDFIISDVSSINDYVAKKSDWYSGVVCNSGADGLKNIRNILKNIHKFLNNEVGIFICPIISLCNEGKLISMLKKKFVNVEFSKKVYWPLPHFFNKNLNTYLKLKKEKKINFTTQFSLNIAHTYVAICKNNF